MQSSAFAMSSRRPLRRLCVIDLRPSAQRLTDLIASIGDDQLALATPCPDTSVGDLIDHLGVFAVSFVGSAHKQGGRTSPPPAPSASNLGDGWQERVSHDLLALADAWSDPEAWEGTTHAGSIEMPASLVGLVAIDEMVVHGWDLAVSTGQPYDPPVEDIAAARSFVESFEVPRDGGLFGPIVPVPDDATPLDQLLGLTGRDPLWRA